MLRSAPLVVLAFVLGVLPIAAFAQLDRYVPNAQSVGKASLSIMVWDIFDAELIAPNAAWDRSQPFALKLSYKLNIAGKRIADRSIKEIRDQGFSDEIKLADWHAQMIKIFPDVNSDTSLVGVYTASKETVFLNNNREIGRIADPEFGKYFFDIWLGPKSSQPKLRRQLLGRS